MGILNLERSAAAITGPCITLRAASTESPLAGINFDAAAQAPEWLMPTPAPKVYVHFGHRHDSHLSTVTYGLHAHGPHPCSIQI